MTPYILQADNISKHYAGHTALDKVSIHIPRGAVFGLLGPNGAGKTTFIRIVTQIISLDEGTILFDNQPLTPAHTSRIGYMPEERGLYKKMKVGEQLLYLAQLKGLSKKEALERLKIWFTKFDIKSWWNKNVEDLSKGMQQKIQFIATVLHEPELLILDEPFSGFDPVNANLIKEEILELRQKGCTIIFSTHRMDSVESLCDYLALINKSKKMLDGKTQEIKQSYHTNIYTIEYAGVLHQISPSFEVMNQEKLGENQFRSFIKDKANIGTKALLAELIEQVEIKSFAQKIPTIEEIFISIVTGEPIGFQTTKSIDQFSEKV
ncbi:MAG: ATP-binding cassette domain-containing protein [Microscillaceae bacterium]|nr:ATP-binding cassette domain-containing protein [Microscillaceae bacterium]MDW8461218.1 ATP-binding cassette domain-containing protein [Cytophagales bacterium]